MLLQEVRTPSGRAAGTMHAVTARHRRYISMLCRQHTVAAIDTLVEIMSDKQANPAARIRAAENILDRGYGKAPQQISLEVAENKPLADMSDDELLALIADDRQGVHDRLNGEMDENDEWEEPNERA